MGYSGNFVEIPEEEHAALLALATTVREELAAYRVNNVEVEKVFDSYQYTMHFMPDYDYAYRLAHRAEQIPEEVFFMDDEGVEYDDIDPIQLTWDQKLFIAAKSIQWKQSIEVTLDRIIIGGIKQQLRRAEKVEQ